MRLCSGPPPPTLTHTASPNGASWICSCTHPSLFDNWRGGFGWDVGWIGGLGGTGDGGQGTVDLFGADLGCQLSQRALPTHCTTPLHHSTAPLHHSTIVTPTTTTTTTTTTTGTHAHVRPACACAPGGAWHLGSRPGRPWAGGSSRQRTDWAGAGLGAPTPCRVWLVWWTCVVDYLGAVTCDAGSTRMPVLSTRAPATTPMGPLGGGEAGAGCGAPLVTKCGRPQRASVFPDGGTPPRVLSGRVTSQDWSLRIHSGHRPMGWAVVDSGACKPLISPPPFLTMMPSAVGPPRTVRTVQSSPEHIALAQVIIHKRRLHHSNAFCRALCAYCTHCRRRGGIR